MKILHYSLGFPPYRSGGLTKFCIDIMKQQNIEGHEVALMWPGQMGFALRETCVKDRGFLYNIRSFEVINPLPVSYDEGINKIEEFIQDVPVEIYKVFLEQYKPDVIHIHTLMGLHKAFLTAAKSIGIKIVFTTHDFFPICPKVTMFCGGSICHAVADCSHCLACNDTSLSLPQIRILQSPFYRRMKDSAIVKKLRKKHRDAYLGGDKESISTTTTAKNDANSSMSQDYLKLRDNYKEMLSLVDAIHYNSSLTKGVYDKYLGSFPGEIISITHENIKDNRREKSFDSDELRIRYLGPYSKSKGFMDLISALNNVDLAHSSEHTGYNKFTLGVHFEMKDKPDYIRCNARYDYRDLTSIFDDTDVLIVPSRWNETFGYTVLEALSFGVPVIMSDTVGARDILFEGAGIVYSTNEELTEIINNLSKDKLHDMNNVICKSQKIMTVEEMNQEIMDRFYFKGN